MILNDNLSEVGSCPLGLTSQMTVRKPRASDWPIVRQPCLGPQAGFVKSPIFISGTTGAPNS